MRRVETLDDQRRAIRWLRRVKSATSEPKTANIMAAAGLRNRAGEIGAGRQAGGRIAFPNAIIGEINNAVANQVALRASLAGFEQVAANDMEVGEVDSPSRFTSPGLTNDDDLNSIDRGAEAVGCGQVIAGEGKRGGGQSRELEIGAVQRVVDVGAGILDVRCRIGQRAAVFDDGSTTTAGVRVYPPPRFAPLNRPGNRRKRRR